MIETREIMGLVFLGLGIGVFILWLILLWRATK